MGITMGFFTTIMIAYVFNKISNLTVENTKQAISERTKRTTNVVLTRLVDCTAYMGTFTKLLEDDLNKITLNTSPNYQRINLDRTMISNKIIEFEKMIEAFVVQIDIDNPVEFMRSLLSITQNMKNQLSDLNQLVNKKSVSSIQNQIMIIQNNLAFHTYNRPEARKTIVMILPNFELIYQRLDEVYQYNDPF